ncbi:MAG: hypothetical protein IPP69_08220 [Flavobacteriales bacterium]|nr:hypothetical protein [Flavobacteriales bacterium]
MLKLLPLLLMIIASKMLEASVDVDSTRKPITPIEIRLKALGFVIIEDEWVGSLAFGAEWPFGRKYSLVTDIVHLRWRHEREFYNQPKPEDYVEYGQTDRKNYFTVELRRYMFNSKNTWNRFYIAGWHKSGIRKIQSEDLYLDEDNDIVQQHSHFFDAGGSLGYKFGKPCWYFDVSLGYGYRWECIDQQEIFHTISEREFRHDLRHDRSTFHIRVNFSIPFCS